uniref:Uncharacterized protein n=1 Tax=Anopheles dirus TaxID=7168 RepID=A0A182NX64_9DIPT
MHTSGQRTVNLLRYFF